MGYYAFATGLKIEELQSAIGSEDDELLMRVRDCEHFKNVYSDVATEDGKFTLDNAVKELIAGDISRPDAGYVYGYALICLCHALGEALPLDNEIKVYVETAFIDKLLQQDFGLPGFGLIESLFPDEGDWHQFIPLLPEIEDWPSGAFLTLAQVKKLYARLESVQLSEEQLEEWENSDDEDDEEKAYAGEHVMALQANLRFCIDRGLDMAWFGH